MLLFISFFVTGGISQKFVIACNTHNSCRTPSVYFQITARGLKFQLSKNRKINRNVHFDIMSVLLQAELTRTLTLVIRNMST